MTDLEAFADCCPRCHVARVPHLVTEDGDQWVTALYHCDRCDRTWCCGWGVGRMRGLLVPTISHWED